LVSSTCYLIDVQVIIHLIKGSKKIALIDAVNSTKKEVLIINLRELGIKHIDYIGSQEVDVCRKINIVITEC